MQYWPLIIALALPSATIAQNGALPEDTGNIGTFDGNTGIYQTCVVADGIGGGYWNVQLRGTEAPSQGPDMFSLELIAATEAEFGECGTLFDPDTGEFIGLVYASNVGADFDERTFLFEALIDPDVPGFKFLTNLSEDFVNVSAPDDSTEVNVQFAALGSFTNTGQRYTLSQRPASLTLTAPVCQAMLASANATVSLPVSLEISASGLSTSSAGDNLEVATGDLATGSYLLSASCQAMFGDQTYSSESTSFLLTIEADQAPVPPNNAPSFTKGADQTVNEDAGAQTVTHWAADISAGPASEAGQIVAFNTSNNNNTLFATQPTIDGDGTLTYTPADDASGSTTVTVNVQDNGGTANGGVNISANQTFTITINAVNDAPLLTSQTVTVDEDSGAYTSTVASAGPGESGQSLTVTATGNSNASLFATGPTIDTDGSLTFTPADDASGDAEITLELSDDGGTDNGGADSATATLTIKVTPVNDAPIISATLARGTGSPGVGRTHTITTPHSADPDFDLLGPDKAMTVTYGELIESATAGAQEGDQTVTLSVVDVNNALSSDAIISEDGDLTLAFSDAIADGPILIEIHATDDGGTDNGGADTTVLPLRIIPSEPSTVQSRSITGKENQRCVAISLRSNTFKGVRNPDNMEPSIQFVIETLPARGTLYTADLATEVTAGAAFSQREFCFVPDEYTFSEPGEIYASFTFSKIDDFDIASENTATFDIEIEGIFF